MLNFQSNFSGRRFIVTGARGFIGSRLARELEALEAEVQRLDIESATFSLSDLGSYIERTDGVFHVGANSNTLEENVPQILEENVVSTKLWAEACRDHCRPLIYSSSAAVYGTSRSRPANLYGWSKFLGEEFSLAYGGVALRYFNVYGPGEDHKGPMASLAKQAFESHRKGEMVRLFPGNPTRDFIHVDDVVRANLHAFVHHKECAGKHYDVGTGRSISFEEVLTIMELNFQYHPPGRVPPGYQFHTQADVGACPPGWRAQILPSCGFAMYRDHLKRRSEDGARNS